jgi:hypothetical protein
MRRHTSSICLIACLGALGTGCADNQETLIVLMAPAWEMGECAIQTGSTDALPFGTLDLSFGTPYLMPALLLNNTAQQATNDNNTGVVSNEIQLLDADVDLSIAQAPEIIDALEDMDDALVSFNVPLSTNSIPPGEVAGAMVEVIPQQTAVAMGELIQAQFGAGSKLTVEAHVRFHATRTANNVGKVGAIDAREFTFPISVCFGCLLTCSTCPGAECPVGTTSYAGGVCGNAQDFVLYPAACDMPD